MFTEEDEGEPLDVGEYYLLVALLRLLNRIVERGGETMLDDAMHCVGHALATVEAKEIAHEQYVQKQHPRFAGFRIPRIVAKLTTCSPEVVQSTAVAVLLPSKASIALDALREFCREQGVGDHLAKGVRT